MIFGYIRVSTDKQTVENQRFEIKKYANKENIIINSWIDETSKVLAFAFSISAEIERTLLSQRTTVALKRKKNEGVKLGRPKGKKNTKYKLTGKEEVIKQMLQEGFPKSYIYKHLNVSPTTFYSFIKKNNFDLHN